MTAPSAFCRFGRVGRRLRGSGAVLLGLLLAAFTGRGDPTVALAQVVPYNPYADSQDPTPPVLPDGTIHWGTFFKSPAIQKAYERLWNLGACRNTNKAITIPVENNKLSIDSLPEDEFRGVVKGVTGTNAGGAVAFVHTPSDGSGPVERVALLHPAGVSHVDVNGTSPVSLLAPGMVVRFQANVDGKGRASSPIRVLHVATPAADAKPTAVTPGIDEMIVGKVVQLKRGTLSVRVDAGKIRRLTLPLADDAVVEVATTQIGIVRPGDVIEIKGRLWAGEGALGDGTVFADRVTVTKTAPHAAESAGKRPGEKADAGILGAR